MEAEEIGVGPYSIAERRLKAANLTSSLNKRALYHGIIVVTLVAGMSIALTMQGWRSRVPAFDLLTYIYGARNFLETGAILQHGDTGSYGSYKPAGTAWLMLPGTLLFSDPRLSDYVGTALLHISTLLGIYLLTRKYFGVWCAGLAVVLYGFSAHSIFLAGSLWPNGRPDFYVWVVYLSSIWAAKRDARYLAGALAVWGLGMYVDMAITPVLFILPVIWYFYKPPVRLKPLLLAGGIILIVWLPYLRFEIGRGFADIRSQLLQQHILPANPRASWCDSNLVLLEWSDYSGESISQQTGVQTAAGLGPLNQILQSSIIAKDKLLYNYEPVAPVPGASMILLLMTFGGLLLLSVSGVSTKAAPMGKSSPFWRNRFNLIAMGMIASAVLLSGLVLISGLLGIEGALQGSKLLLLEKIRKILLLSGAAMLAFTVVVEAANNWLTKKGIHVQPPELVERRKLLVISLVIPWFLLFVMSEPGKPERFMWLWPLQSIVLAALLVNFLPILRLQKPALLISQLAVILVIAGNPFLLSRVDAWFRNGWAGTDAAEIQVVDVIAQQIKADGKDRAAIGYRTFIYPFMAEYNITNPVYKAGAEFDLLFKYRHGITNLNQCAEGVAAGDEYRIVETRPKPTDWSPKNYFSVPLDGQYYLVDQVGHYLIYKIDQAY